MCRPIQPDKSKSSGSKHQLSKLFKDCILKNCCNSCSYCCRSRAAAKEKPKSRSLSDRNKTCQKCFFCLSLSFCPSCTKCPQCCRKSSCGRQVTKVFGKSLGSNPRVVSILKEGYNLPFKMRPPLTRSPLIVSGYGNPRRNKYLKEALQSLITKQAVEKVVVRASVAFYNRLFIVPKPNNKWRPILDLSKLNLFLHSDTFKMETPETIRISLQKGEWVSSLDFSDAYFHIPINPRSRKYLRFHLHGQTFQFRALPFGLATAPLEFTKVVN